MTNLSQQIAKLSPLKLALAAQQLQSTLGVLHAEPIAVIGVGCRFPKAIGPEAYWQLLRNGIDAIGEVPGERWDVDAFYDPNPDAAGKMYSRYGGFLDAVDGFDAEFFGVAPREAHSLDPQQRLLLEVSWEALESANQVPEKLYGSSTGVFVGICTSDYAKRLLGTNDLSQIDAYYGTGNALSVAAGRLSYTLGLTGPCLSVDTACSSSLVSVHLACQSLRQRECDLALAGGVNLILSPENTITFSRARMLSPDGRCKTFDAAADGYVRGEGCGVVTLKRLSDAIADGDRIFALIRGSAVNQDGPSGGLTVPNGPSQQTVIRQALAHAGIDPAQVNYIEAHGTGTALGDPIEVGALGAVFGKNHSPDVPLWLGSAKTNIGHLEGAAGIAGLIKVVLSLHHGEIPPHLHFQKPSPHIPWDQLPVKVPTAPTPWPDTDQRIAGVSSFGFSGTNAHVVLEAAPVLPAVAVEASPQPAACLLPLSARSKPALQQLVEAYRDWLQAQPEVSLADLCFNASNGRSHFTHRLALTATDLPHLQEQLQAIANDKAPLDSAPAPRQAPKLAFLFTGQGSQYVGMGRTLYETQPLFKATLDRCSDFLKPQLDHSLIDLLYQDADPAAWNRPLIVQPLLFAVEYALAELWQAWGVKPNAVFGHSLGEYVAACVAGVLRLEDSLTLLVERAKLMESLEETGTMAAVFADAATVASAIAEFPDVLSLAALNGPNNAVIAGHRQTLETVLDQLQNQGIDSKLLDVSHGFHSPLLEPMLDQFEKKAREMDFHAPKIPLVSNLTGQRIPANMPMDAHYWRRHTREPVQFADAIATLHNSGHTLFLEIGPHPVLSTMGKRCLEDAEATWLPSLRRGKDPWQTLMSSLGQLYRNGIDIDWESVYPAEAHQKLSLPTYPFQRQRYWIDLSSASTQPVKPPTPASAAYALKWQQQDLSIAKIPADPGNWLILCDADDLWQALSQSLKAQGGVPIRVTWGTEFVQLQANHYQVNPQQEHPFQSLLTALADQSRGTVNQILYVASPDSTAQELTQPLLALFQALASEATPGRPKLWIVTTNAQSISPSDAVSAPQQAVLWGIGRTLRLEHPELWGGLIDLPTMASDVASSPPDTLTNVLVKHILAQDREDEAAIRRAQRWVPRLQQLALPLPPPSPETSPVHKDATYLITGGTGGLGQQLTRWLVEQGARHLVLLSRRGHYPELETVLAPLREQGTTVWIEAVDMADTDALAALLKRIQQQLPPLKGVFHAAGVLADGFLTNQTPEQFQRVMPAKLQGAWQLHQLTQGLELDWFVLFSSIASVLGSPGQGNYSAANAGLDALAYYRQQQGLPALSISWGPWQEAGMAVNHQPTADSWAQRGMAPLSVEDGLQWISTLLSQAPSLSQPHVGVACIDWPRLQRYLPSIPPVMAELATHQGQPQQNTISPDGSEQFVANRLLQRLLTLPEADRVSELLTYFQTQVAQVMGIQDQVPLDRPLLDLGIDSLMTMDLLALCKQDLHLVLYPREVMAHPTVSDLAQYVAKELDRVHHPVNDAASSEEATLDLQDASLPGHPWQAPAPLDPVPTRRNDGMVFLLSAPRSGSTLLRVMLAGHPGLFCPPELHLLPFNTLEAQQTALGSSYLQEGLQRALMELLQLDADQSQALLEEWSQHRLTVPQVYDKLQQTAAPRLLVDKSPTYSFSLETLERAEQIFSGAKYIHLVRHPYAVMDSFVRNRMHKIFDITTADPYRLAEQVWQISNHNIATFLNGLNPSCHFLLRYEDLVADAEAAMQKLCDFLGLPFDPAVLNPYQGQRMTDGVRAKSLAVDDPNFRQRDRIDPALADVWQSIQLPHPLSPISQRIADQYQYPLPQETETSAIEPQPPSLTPAPLPAEYVPLANLREEYVTLRGRDTCVCHWGPVGGPKLLLLHGILEHGATWDAIADTLANQGYHVIAPDLRGHGRSAHAGPDGGYQLMDFLGDIDALTQSLTEKAQPIMLVGHSMGAVLSAVLASLRPERFSHLVLVEPVVPAADRPQETATQLTAHLDYLATPPEPVVLPTLDAAVQRIRALKPRLSTLTAEKLAERLTHPVKDGVAWRWDPRLQARTSLSLGGGLLDRQSYGQLLQNIAVPATVVFGQDSQFNRPEDLAFLTSHLSEATRLTLPGGHDLPSETPVELAQAIQRLLQKEHR
jgi:acyl transferase domain-containing protein